MRSLHFMTKMLVTAALIASCVFVFMYPVSDLWTILIENIPDNDLYRQGLAGLAGLGVLLAFLPLWPNRRSRLRTFTFQGAHGEVLVELEPVEATLERVLNKLPEVKWATVRMIPKEGTPMSMQVDIKGVFRREDASDIRHTSAWVQSFVKSRTQKMLGVQDVNVRLHLKSQITNMKSFKPEPLLLEGPGYDEPRLPDVVHAEAPNPGESRSNGGPASATPGDIPSELRQSDSRYSDPAFQPNPEAVPAEPNADPGEPKNEDRDGAEPKRGELW